MPLLTFIIGCTIGGSVGFITFVWFIFKSNDIEFSIQRVIFTTITYYRRFKLIHKKQNAFRISKQEIQNEAFPEYNNKQYIKSHPYINLLPFATPSIEYREFDDLIHPQKLKKLQSNNKTKKPTPKEIVATTRRDLSQFEFLIGKPSSKCNTIIDNIYLNTDIKFCVISYNGADAKNGVIIYAHGGAYMGGSHKYPLSMLSKLSQLTGCVAISVDYKCPPEFPLPRCVEDMVCVYEWLCDYKKVRSGQKMNISDNCPKYLIDLPVENMNKKIIIAGDSAGGGLCLLTVQAIKERESLGMPCCAWPISPWTSLTGFDDKEIRNQVRDTMLTGGNGDVIANLVVGNIDMESGEMKEEKNGDYKDPKGKEYSPVYGDFKGLCPLCFSVGASEVLLDDTLAAAEKAYKEGVEVEVEIEPYLCHCYPIFVNIFPEALYSVVRVSEFINKHLKN